MIAETVSAARPVDPALFREAMRLTASGVAVVTTDGAQGRAGLTVSTLCSLSMEPPSVVLCVHNRSKALETLLANGVFCANVLRQDQTRVADSFAGAIPELRDDRFAAGSWSLLETGAPVLDGALCGFDCRVAKVFDFGSHRIIAGEVLALATAPSEPLVFSNRAYRRLDAMSCEP
ncbi:flavin reductase [Skermanella stibiiresistens SB22]|uniref:Flavin reductase n=1 Tax=Skermanella stibiiresistens SB22 TaxID=1385369 RepID=W9GVJ6_9PROT|nr:flavin reductase family protein [Skermanella stibiiresistens]EWY37824.1 flavin reductase [Skermanella stibiiresistens SB22]